MQKNIYLIRVPAIRPFALEHHELMAKGNEFELQRGPVSKAWEDGGEQQRKDH